MFAAKHAGRSPAMELAFNEIVRKLQIEKAERLCTAPQASVYSYPINLQN